MATFAPQVYQREGLDGQRRRQIVQVMEAALRAVDPEQAVRAWVKREGDILHVGEHDYDLRAFERVLVIGAGKAGAPMVLAIEDLLGDRLSDGCVNVKCGYTAPTRKVFLNEAGHPIPDDAGLAGAQRIRMLLQEAQENDLVICLFSGGGSALMALPVEGISLQDLQHLTDALLRVGATIDEINTIRKHLEILKGGGVARLAYPATVISLILSDVVGNRLDVIASGPTVPDPTTFADAYAILERYQLLEQVPKAVVDHLRAGLEGLVEETPKADDPAFERVLNLIVASNEIAARAALREASEIGFHSMLLSTFVEGEAREVAKVFVGIAREILHSGAPLGRPACVIAGGETTVTIRGNGRGGRNQEMALMAAIRLEGLDDVAIACLGTDGTDGPTDAAGALVDGSTIRRGRKLGLDAWRHLENNDSYAFFAPLGDLLITGPTNTNVNDLIFVLVW